MRDERKGDHDKDDGRDAGGKEAKVNEAPYRHDGDADQIHRLASNHVRQVAEQRNRDEGHKPRRADRPGQERLVELGRKRAEGEHECREQIERRLLGETQQSAEDDLSPVAPDNLPDRCVLDAALLQQCLEDGRLHDPEPDVETDADEDDAQKEGQPPCPGVKGRGAGHRHRQSGDAVSEDEPDRYSKLGPAAEPALALLASPLHGHQHRAAPLTAHADALARAQDDQDGSGTQADRRVGRHQSDQERCDSHEHQRRDERGLAPDAVAICSEQPGADGPCQETNKENAEAVQRPCNWVRLREEERRENERRHRGEQKVVVPLDRGAYRAGDDRPQHLFSPFLGRHGRIRRDIRHVKPPPHMKLSKPTAINWFSTFARSSHERPGAGSQLSPRNRPADYQRAGSRLPPCLADC